VPDAETSFLSGSSTDDSHLRTLELGMEEALEPGQRQSRLLDEILAEGSENSSLGSLPDPIAQITAERDEALIQVDEAQQTITRLRLRIPDLETDIFLDEQLIRQHQQEAHEEIQILELELEQCYEEK
ncbi:11741_t:CDS:1, partial [Ambispora leptoticha]